MHQKKKIALAVISVCILLGLILAMIFIICSDLESEPDPVPETIPPTEAAIETTPPTEPALEIPEEEEKFVYDTVPQMFQNDYPKVWYSSGKLAKTGCSITCAAMVCSYMTDTEYTPDVLAEMFNKSAYSNDRRMENALNHFDIRWEKCFYYPDLKEKLHEGYMAIVLVGPNSPFTTGSHFILLTGVTEDDLVMVNDPQRDNYTRWRLKSKYEEGFPHGYISVGYRGAWLIEPKKEYWFRIITNSPGMPSTLPGRLPE